MIFFFVVKTLVNLIYKYKICFFNFIFNYKIPLKQFKLTIRIIKLTTSNIFNNIACLKLLV